METKHQVFKLDIKTAEVAESGEMIIAGYGNVFNIVDAAYDVVMPGAFDKTLDGRDPKDIKMFYNHDIWSKPVGVYLEVKPDEHGLYIEGKLAPTAEGKDLYELVKMGAVSGLSIGYVTKDYFIKDGISYITELDLYEVSLTPFPCNQESKIDKVKSSEMTTREMERFLVKNGLSNTVAEALTSGRWEGAEKKSQRDSDFDSELIAMINSNINKLKI